MKLLKHAIVAILFITGCNDIAVPILKIKPPFKNFYIPEAQVRIDPSMKQVARFDNGISIEIPKNAFQDGLGNMIEEEVTITILTYETAAQIIASGIPMTFHDGDGNRNFESAGMFQISGRVDSLEVFVAEGKELIINYSSNVYGEFDFFHFASMVEDSIVSGQWKKLTTKKTVVEWSADTLEKFKLQFAKDDYSALAPLSSIDWKLATNYENPNKEKNHWVLEEAWSSLELAQPKLGFGKTIFDDTVNYDQYLGSGAIVLSKDKQRIITSKQPLTKIWTREGKLIKTIDKVRTDYMPVRILNNEFLLVERESGDDIFDFDGNLIGHHPKTRYLEIANSINVVVYYEWGTTAPIVYISTVSGKLIKKIELWEDVSSWDQPNIFEKFILTENDELITNSLDGIQFFNLSGKLLTHRDEEFLDIENFKKDWLLLKGMDGELTVWDFKNRKENTSKTNYFDVRMKVEKRNNTWTSYSSEYQIIPNTTLITIREAKSKKSKLWDYKSNEITDLDFYLYDSPYDTLPPDVMAGYDAEQNLYYIYDVIRKKKLFNISGLNPGFGMDNSSYGVSLSKDGQYFLINCETHSLYYHVDGTLIQDFKQVDSLVEDSRFRGNDEIITISLNGIYRVWDRTGKQLSSKQFTKEFFNQYWVSKNQMVTWNPVFAIRNYYDFNGHLTLNFGWSHKEFMDSTEILYASDEKKGVLKTLFELPPDAYQLILRNDTKKFLTYVYLDDNELEVINHYYTFRAKQIQQEVERIQAENQVLRRFRINQMGLYNWDKLLEDENNIQFVANFEFDVPVEYNDITIFLITEFNGQTVIPFGKKSWNQFWINPHRKNQLMAILPDNKVATYSLKDMDAVDFATISRQKKYTFKMKTFNKPILDLKTLETLID